MPKINLRKLNKAEIISMAEWRCEHGHSGLEHPECYRLYAVLEEKIGYFDIETSGLQADFNFILSWCIKEKEKDDFKQGIFSAKDYKEVPVDKRMVKDCVEALSGYTTIITYYGTNFDLPFLRTRALKANLPFPFYGSIRHIDLYYVVRNKLRIHRNRLDAACELFGVYDKTRIRPEIWERALSGDKESLSYVAEHNKIDTILLEKLHDKIEPFMKETKRSI